MNSTALEALLEVGIGMVFMWLILSIATMSIQEWIASYLKWRAKDLEAATRRLLGDPAWSAQLYAHPLIQGLTKNIGDKPSYIPANKFALALFDVVMTAGTPESYIQRQLHAAQAELDKAPNGLVPLITYIAERWKRNILSILPKFLDFFTRQEKVTKEQKFADLLKLLCNIVADEKLNADKLKELLERFFENDKGKNLEQLFAIYPELKENFNKLLVKLKVPDTSRKELDSYLEKMGQTKIEAILKDHHTYELLIEQINKAKQTLIQLNPSKQGTPPNAHQNSNHQLELLKEGLAVVKENNPDLYKVLYRMLNDLIGVANNTQIMDSVREQFAKAAAEAKETELNLEAMRLGSETWFNESMERLGGWYKRKATVLAFVIGLVFASFMNIDSITLAQHLWKEPTVRQALAANATEFIKENPELPATQSLSPAEAVDYFNNQFTGLTVPLGWTVANQAPIYKDENGDDQPAPCEIIPVSPHAVWGYKNDKNCLYLLNFPTDAFGRLTKFLGIIISAAAAAQGAPFWFDILKKLVNIRGTGANPTETEQKNK